LSAIAAWSTGTPLSRISTMDEGLSSMKLEAPGVAQENRTVVVETNPGLSRAAVRSRSTSYARTLSNSARMAA
jgi:hypothetical protein